MIIETATLISIGSWIGNKIIDKGFDEAYEKITSSSFDKKFYKKVELATKRLQKDHPEAFGGNIEYLFKHDDVFNETLKLLFVDAKIDISIIEDKFDNETLPDNFLLKFFTYLREELYKDPFFRKILEDKMLYLTVVGINRNIEEFVSISQISAKEIQEIKEILKEKFKNNFSLDNFIQQYGSCLINNYSQLNFIGLGLDLTIKKGKRKKLEELFVQPNFSIDENDLETVTKKHPDINDFRNINLLEIFDFNENLVILGNPGSGKSILTKFITLKIIQKNNEVFGNKKVFNRVPFRIELRKYHSFKKDQKEGLTKYLRYLIELEFGFSNISCDDLEKILIKRETLIIFDGLDEIFDIEDKLEITHDIENFISRFSKAQIIVTSRFIGYNDAALKENIAIKLNINKFHDAQIEEYIRNWYTVEEEDHLIREKEIEDLLSKKSLIDREIISNPLLLSLIVILYRNNLKVPESKLEIYQSCTKTLVDKWDFSKNLKISLPEEIYKRKDTIFADLAFWQYKELSAKEGKITFARAKNTVAKTLTDKLKIVDEFTSDLYAEKFLEYAEKRSLYFENNFTHKTFLEYFTAFWIFSNIEKKHKKAERDQLIAEYVTSSYWHIVLELLMNLIDKDQADNEIIDDLVLNQLKLNEKSATFFLQIFSSIQNVSISTYENIITLVIKKALLDQEDSSKDKRSQYNPRNTSIFFILSEHYKNELLKDSIGKILLELIDTDVKQQSLLTFYLEIQKEINQSKNKEEDIEDEIYYSFDQSLVSKDSLNFLLELFQINYSSFIEKPTKKTKEFLKLFGTEESLKQIKSKFSNFTYFPFIIISLRHTLFKDDYKELEKFFQLVQENEISLMVIVEKIFQFPLFDTSEENLEKMIINFNQANCNDCYLILVAIIYSIRFQDRYFENNYKEKSLEPILNKVQDSTLNKQLKYIWDKRNSRKSVRNYLNDNFGISEETIMSR